MKPVLLAGEPPELLLYDQQESCPYLEGETARMPMRLPVRRLTPDETDRHLASGDRRHGRLLYRTRCPECSACQPIRLDVEAFRPSRSHRRALRIGDEVLTYRLGRPRFSPERLALYEKHKWGRDLVTGGGQPLGEAGYRGFLVDECVDSFELTYWVDDRLVGVAVTDRGETSLSLVYCFFDPEERRVGIGTYSILKHVELAKEWGLRYVYLGLYIGANAHMSYKARFRPHQRLVDGEWREFADR